MKYSLFSICLLALLGFPLVEADNQTEIVYRPEDVVQEIVMEESYNEALSLPFPDVKYPFVDTLSATSAMNKLTITTPGSHLVVQTASGRKTKPSGSIQEVESDGDFLVMRVRRITRVLVNSITASPSKSEKMGVKLTHTVTNTDVQTSSNTKSWDSEATVTARAEASADFAGLSASVSSELSSSVKYGVTSTYERSKSTTEEVSSELSFELTAPKGKTAALWISSSTIDIYTCSSDQATCNSRPPWWVGYVTFGHNCDFVGQDIKVISAISSWQNCHVACGDPCTHWTYNPVAKECYLKKGNKHTTGFSRNTQNFCGYLPIPDRKGAPCDGALCSPQNGWIQDVTVGQKCDFIAQDIKMVSAIPSWENCHVACGNDNICTHWTYNYVAKQCFLKKGNKHTTGFRPNEQAYCGFKPSRYNGVAYIPCDLAYAQKLQCNRCQFSHSINESGKRYEVTVT
jgi:hypothetical protein